MQFWCPYIGKHYLSSCRADFCSVSRATLKKKTGYNIPKKVVSIYRGLGRTWSQVCLEKTKQTVFWLRMEAGGQTVYSEVEEAKEFKIIIIKIKNKDPQHFHPPPVWACITLRQNHTNTHTKTTSLCTGFKNNISSVQCGHPDYLTAPFTAFPTAVTTWRQKQNVLHVFGFTTMSWFQRTWGGQRHKKKTTTTSHYGITFENRTLKRPFVPCYPTCKFKPHTPKKIKKKMSTCGI